jgi:hypothetical protein
LSIRPLKKGGADKPPAISKRVKINFLGLPRGSN